MPNRSQASGLSFFGHWLRNPKQTAAIAPSSLELANAVLAELPDGAKRVIEFGGGTGVITQALLGAGIAPADLMVLELNPSLHAQLQSRFPGVQSVLGDAVHSYRLATESGYLAQGAVDAVVSGLGLLAMSRDAQAGVLTSAFDCMRPGGVLVQFTYGPMAPASEDLIVGLGLSARRGEFVLRNVPPATVWTIRRSRTKGIKPRTVQRQA